MMTASGSTHSTESTSPTIANQRPPCRLALFSPMMPKTTLIGAPPSPPRRPAKNDTVAHQFVGRGGVG
jgi:hypothetical protein